MMHPSGGSQGGPLTLSYATADGTAAAPGDYAPLSGSVTIAPSQTAANFTVNVVGDYLVEPDEFFTVNVTLTANGAVLQTSTVKVTTANDDKVRARRAANPWRLDWVERAAERRRSVRPAPVNAALGSAVACPTAVAGASPPKARIRHARTSCSLSDAPSPMHARRWWSRCRRWRRTCRSRPQATEALRPSLSP
jgi:hypothetical protein